MGFLVCISHYSVGCGYCKQAKPTFVRLADRYKEYQFYEFDIEENEKLLKYSNVGLLPTLKVTKYEIFSRILT